MDAMKRYSAEQQARNEELAGFVDRVSEKTGDSIALFVRAMAMGAELAEKQKEPA